MITESIETNIDVFEHDFNRLVHVWQRWSSGHFYSFTWLRNCYQVSALYFKCLDKELRTYRENFASYLRNTIRSIKNVLNVPGRNINQGSLRSCDNVPGTSRKLLAEDFTTYHERVASHLKKMLQRTKKNLANYLKNSVQRIRGGRASYLQVGRCCKYQERPACYWTKMIQHTRNINQGSWRSCDNVPATSCKLLAKDFATYHERVANQLKKMLQRIWNILHITWGKMQRIRKVVQVTC